MTDQHAPAAPEAPIRVVLVDDQSLVRAGFALVIDSQSDLEVVGQAGDGDEAVDVVTRVQPDVVLMDVRMPRLDGIQATARILRLADAGTIRAPRIIVLTTFDEDEYALAAQRGGASGFLLKDVLPEILLDSIRTVVDGGAVIAPSTTRRLFDSQLLRPPQPPAADPASGTPAGSTPAGSDPAGGAPLGAPRPPVPGRKRPRTRPHLTVRALTWIRSGLASSTPSPRASGRSSPSWVRASAMRRSSTRCSSRSRPSRRTWAASS